MAIVNALDLGMDGSGANGAENRTKWQKVADQGYGVYFPGGNTFAVEGDVIYNGQDGVEIYGDGPSSKLLQTASNSRLIDYRNGNFFECRNLHIQGRNVSLGTPEPITSVGNTISNVSLIFTSQSESINIHDVITEGCAGYSMHISQCDVVNITDNECLRNNAADADHTDPGGYGGQNIQVLSNNAPNLTTPIIQPRYINISGNRILGNGRLGLACSFNYADHAVINDNVVIACDDNLDPITSAPIWRLHGILIIYNTNYLDPALLNSSQKIVCCGNRIQGARWAGIYGNAQVADQIARGLEATLNNNVISDVALEYPGAIEKRQGGICIVNAKYITANSNTITRIAPAAGGDDASAGLILGSHDPANEGIVTANGNVISKAENDGIIIWGNGFQQVTVSGNNVSCDRRPLRVIASTSSGAAIERSTTITGNDFLSLADDDDICVVSNENRTDEPVLFNDNRVRRGATLVGTTKAMLRAETTELQACNNRFTAMTLTNFEIGIRVTEDSVDRGRLHFADNHFENIHYPYEIPTTSSVPTLHSNTTYNNITRLTRYVNVMFPGFWVDNQAYWFTDANPEGGATTVTWNANDVALNTMIDTMRPVQSWICTTGGQPGSWWENSAGALGMDPAQPDGILGATPAIDFSDFNHRSGVLDQPTVTPTFTMPAEPQNIYWIVIQDSTGGRIIDPTNLPLAPGTVLPFYHLTPDEATIFSWYWDNTYLQQIATPLPPAGDIFQSASPDTMLITSTPQPVTVMDSSGVSDRVVVSPATALIGIQLPGRYTFGFTANLENSSGKEEIFVQFTVNGQAIDTELRGFTRDSGESISLSLNSLADITEADIQGGAGGTQADVQAWIYKVGGGTSTITFYECILYAIRAH